MYQPVLGTVAAGGEHPLIDVDGTLIIQFGLFLLMAFVVTNWLFKPYLRMREEREQGIDGARKEADEMTATADARLAEYQSKLSEARSRAYDEQRKLRIEATEYQAEVTAKARKESGAALEASRTKVRTEVDSARAELMPESEALAGRIAAKLLGRKVA